MVKKAGAVTKYNGLLRTFFNNQGHPLFERVLLISRYCVGESPVAFLKTWLKLDKEVKPLFELMLVIESLDEVSWSFT